MGIDNSMADPHITVIDGHWVMTYLDIIICQQKQITISKGLDKAFEYKI